jgi:hypothetical protein
MEPRWQDPTWLASAQGWIDAQLSSMGLTRTGALEQPYVSLWSTVLRVPTTDGALWFKANDARLRHEAALVELLVTRRRDDILKPLASDTETGWMLMEDAGVSLRELLPAERRLDRWLDVLTCYAELQLEAADAVDSMLAVGVPDLRLTVLPDKYERLMHDIGAERRFRDATAYVSDLCDALGEFGIAETIQHDDLHDGQVFVKDGRHLLMDWGDACVSHPFFTLSVTLEGVLSWGLDDVENSVDTAPFRDAYLAPFAERYGGDLVAATGLALRLGWVCRAVNGHVAGDVTVTETRLRMFLDGRP